MADRNRKVVRFSLAIGLGLAYFVSECAFGQSAGDKMSITVLSTAFHNGGDIPKKFTCDGADVSPQISWKESPPKTASFVLIADDPDAPSGTWTHWIIYDLPAGKSELEENVSKADKLPDGSRQGRNDFGKLGYGGPCPPPRKPHHYSFRIYALDAVPQLTPGASKGEVEQAMRGHLLAKGELVGRYGRQ